MSTVFNIPSTQSQPTTQAGPSTSNFVWPSGFTPPDPAFLPLLSENPFEMASNFGMPEMTDTRLISALQSQTAFIEGDPGGQDLELFYYRLVGPISWSGMLTRSLALPPCIRESTALDSSYNGGPRNRPMRVRLNLRTTNSSTIDPVPGRQSSLTTPECLYPTSAPHCSTSSSPT
jgi:hypothetical protein